jgi:hypothetical protein
MEVREKMKVYQKIAETCNWIQALERTEAISDQEKWESIAWNRLKNIEDNYLMSGSGFDAGTCILEAQSSSKKIVLHSSFHHMNENGMYDGWSEFDIIITPVLTSTGYDVRIVKKDILRKYRWDIDYLYDEVCHCLDKEYEEGGA